MAYIDVNIDVHLFVFFLLLFYKMGYLEQKWVLPFPLSIFFILINWLHFAYVTFPYSFDGCTVLIDVNLTYHFI